MTPPSGRGGRVLRSFFALPSRVTGRFRAAAPERLIIAPQDIRTSDPTIASDINAGYFAFGGKIVNAHGRSPFAIEPGSETWARQLAGFGWLRHLRAADSPAARQRGRQLVGDFLAVHARPSPSPAWEPAVASRRLLAWLSQSPVILEGADRAFYMRFMRALETHRGALSRQMSGMRGYDRMLTALALAEYGLCIKGATALQKRGNDALADEIDAQVLPDGGHVSRNPQTLIDLLLDLLPLRQAYIARGIQAPQQMLNAIDRMVPMLRLFRHGDGTLALFNGMSLTAPELLATILVYDDVRAQPIANAPYTGYQRLEAGSALVIVDSGGIPPRAFSTQAHAGCLSFEFSSSIHRIVINCGAPEGGRGSAQHAARSSAAHSTLVIDDASSCRFAPSQGSKRHLDDQILSGPNVVKAKRSEADGGPVVDMSHDGYAASFGFIHRRTITMAKDGQHFEGSDALIETGNRKAAAVPFAVHFHLHPTVRTRVTDDDATIRLDAPDGDSWYFEADMPALIAPSVLFAATGGPRATTQIKLAANTGTRQQIHWRFRRITP